MNKIIAVLFTFLVLTLPLKAEEVKNIIINGNERISNETVKVYGGIELNKEFSERDSNDILKNLYDTGFFESVEVLFENNKLIVN